MEILHDGFNLLYKGMKKSDKAIIKNILKEIKKYDIYDIIAKLSALNLIPENQNKATVIEPIIASILTLSKDELKSKCKISISKFREIIKLIDNMGIAFAIDPPENPFIDRIMFYDNYNVFTGVNYIPSYILQEMINTIYISDNEFNTEFVKKASVLINFILQISDQVSRKIGINIENLKKYDENSNIIVPREEMLEELKNSIIINENLVERMIGDAELINLLYSNFQNENIENILNIDNQKFFQKPFLKDYKGNVIILSASILIPFLIHIIVNIADNYGEKEKLIQLYNNEVWKQCLRYFNELGNKKIKEDSLNIKLKANDTSYKEILLSGDNKQVIITIGIFDDGRNFNKEKVFDEYSNDGIGKLVDKRLNYITSGLKNKIQDKDIFICLIYNSFGRSMITRFNKSGLNKPILLNPFELKCISINEREQKFFLTRYIRAKNKLIKVPQVFGELPYIHIYTNHEYSFYVDDEFNPKNSVLYLSAGDDIEYIIKSLKKENRHLVKSYNPGYIDEVTLLNEKRKIYLSINIDGGNIFNLFIEMRNIGIWLCDEKIKDKYELSVYQSIMDAISYWLAECKEIIESKEIREKCISIKVSISGKGIDYFYDKECNDTIINTVKIEREGNKILLNISPDTYHCLNRRDNKAEKELILIILKEIIDVTGKDYKKIDEIFSPDRKQKLFMLDSENFPCLKPVDYPQNRRINENDINELLDDIGKYIISLKKWKYGIINEEDKNEVTLLVVDYLYKLLQNKVRKLNPHNLVEAIYLDLEEQIHYMSVFQEKQYSNILCYPEEKEKIWEDFNANQRVTRALKFLMEYVAATPPSGEELLGESEYEQLLAICSLIIEWAYNNDLFRYKIFNSPIEILKSDRIGIKKDEFVIMRNSISNARASEFEYNSTGVWNKIVVENEIEINELDEAFNFENGFTFSEFLQVCGSLVQIGGEQKENVKKIACETLMSKIKKQLKDIDEIKIQKVLKYISLEKRNDFLIPPDGFRVETIYPWRFNRELSFTRRPLIKRDNEYLWGNRNIFLMTTFIRNLISDGKFKTKSKEMNKYIGEISNRRGQAFNESIFNILKTLPELIVDKKVKKINGKKIIDEANNSLGDIDIIYIYDKKKQIVVGEVKDFKLSRDPYEIFCEYREMFEDSDKRKCYSTKLKRRAEWVKEHIEDVKTQYNLCGDGWKVYRVFIVNEHLVSEDIYRRNENIIAISEISLEKLINLNIF